jgi:hypothetical protein
MSEVLREIKGVEWDEGNSAKNAAGIQGLSKGAANPDH